MGLLEAEDVGYGGSYVELHHASFDDDAFLDAFARDDEGRFHFEQYLAAMAEGLCALPWGVTVDVT